MCASSIHIARWLVLLLTSPRFVSKEVTGSNFRNKGADVTIIWDLFQWLVEKNGFGSPARTPALRSAARLRVMKTATTALVEPLLKVANCSLSSYAL